MKTSMRKKAPGRRKTRQGRAYHHGDLRRTLMDTALALVAESDVSALTLREVARRAEVTHGAPYHHFPNKAALVAAIAEEGYRILHEKQLEASNRAGTDPVARLQSLGIAYVKFAVSHPGHFRVMFRMDVSEWGNSPTLADAAQKTMVLLTSTVDEVVRTQGLTVDRMELTLAAWSVAHGLSTLWVDGPLRRSQAFATGTDGGLEELVARVTGMSTSQLYAERPLHGKSGGGTGQSPKARKAPRRAPR